MIVIDANIVLAVVLGEPERAWAIKASRGHEAMAPQTLPFEIGNAITAMFKRNRLTDAGIHSVWKAVTKFEVKLIDVDIPAALRLATAHRLYAYDAYMIQCAIETGSSLMSLDRDIKKAARIIGLNTLEP